MKLRPLFSVASAGLLVLGLSVTVAGPALADATTAGSYNTVSPVRVLDTRYGIGAAKASIAPLATVSFAVPDSGSSSYGAVLLEVTVVNPTAPGYATVFPTGSPRPVVSNVNFQLGQNVPNMVVTQVGPNNRVSIFNGSNGTVDLLADVQGYFAGGPNTGANPGTLTPVTPTRLLDTRSGLGAMVKGKVAPRSVTKVMVAGRDAIPANASAVAINITAVGSAGKGFITAFPGTPLPEVSTVNFEAGQNRANLALAEIGTDGTISLYNGSPYSVDLLADVTGYFVGGGTPAVDGSYVPSSTVRVIDTRQAGQSTGFVPSLATLRVPIFPSGDPFASYIKSVAVNVTAVNPEAAGFLTTWDGTTTVPAVSNVNFQAKHDAAGSIVVPVNPDGTISIYNGSFGNVDLLVDLDGLFTAIPTLDQVHANHPFRAAPTGAQLLAAAQKFLSTPHPATLVSRTR